MVSWAKMLEKTGTPVDGQPLRSTGCTVARNNGRKPTNVMGFGIGTVLP